MSEQNLKQNKRFLRALSAGNAHRRQAISHFAGRIYPSLAQTRQGISRDLMFKVAHLDFSEAHHPNCERLILYCLSSVGQAASHIY